MASSPLSWREALDLRAFVEERSPLPFVGLPDDPDPLGGVYYWAPILLLALVAVLATAVAVLLSATQGRRDAATMHAVGADRRLRGGPARGVGPHPPAEALRAPGPRLTAALHG